MPEKTFCSRRPAILHRNLRSPEEHVRLVMDMRGAPGLRELLDDAEEIETSLEALAHALMEYEGGRKETADGQDLELTGYLEGWEGDEA